MGLLMETKAILFDLDGTLVNTLRVFPQFIAEEFIQDPNPLKIRKYLHRLGEIYNDGDKHSWFKVKLFYSIKVDFNLSWLQLALGLMRVLWLFFQWDRKRHVFPGVLRTLHYLKNQNFLLGIVSNGSPRLLEKRFGPYLGLFDVLVESKSIGYSKPSPTLGRSIVLWMLKRRRSFLVLGIKGRSVRIGQHGVQLVMMKCLYFKNILLRTLFYANNWIYN